MQANEFLSKVKTSLRSLSDVASSLSRFQTATLVELALLLALGGLFTYMRARPSTVRVLGKTDAAASEPRAETLTVHVAGAVNRPGLYTA